MEKSKGGSASELDRDRESASVFCHDHGSQRRGPEDETEAQESLDVAQGKVAVAPVRGESMRLL